MCLSWGDASVMPSAIQMIAMLLSGCVCAQQHNCTGWESWPQSNLCVLH